MNQPTLDFGDVQLAEAPRSLSELKQWKCSECGADFPAKGNGRAKRCKDCRAKNPTARKRYSFGPFICQNQLCGKEFHVTGIGGLNRKDQKRGEYCSRSCYHHGRKFNGFLSEEIFLCDALIAHVHKTDRAKRTKDRRAWLKTPEGRKWRNNDAKEHNRKYKGIAPKDCTCKQCGKEFNNDSNVSRDIFCSESCSKRWVECGLVPGRHHALFRDSALACSCRNADMYRRLD